MVQTGATATSLEVLSEFKLADSFTGWYTIKCYSESTPSPAIVRLKFSGSGKIRVRQVRVFSIIKPVPGAPSSPAAARAAEALKVFRDLASEVYRSLYV